MKKLFATSSLTRLCAGGGILCLALRKWLLSTAVDGAGLLDHGHPGNWLSFGIAALVAAVLLLSVRKSEAVRIVPGKTAGFGLVIAALGYLAAGATVWMEAAHPLRNLIVAAALASAICSLWMLIGMCRVKRVPALAYAPAVVFFLLYMVCRYHPWSSEPEPQSCFFHIVALAGLTVTSYLRGNLMLSRKSWKGYVQVSRWAIFAAIAAIPGCVDAVPLALWAAALLLDGCKARKSL